MKQFWVITNIIILIMFCNESAGARSWSYKNIENWNKIGACDGVRQSPIDIKKENVEYWSGLKKITIENAVTESTTLKNTGYGLTIGMSGKTTIKFGTDGQITLHSMHWHWGSDNSKGSEHKLDGKVYPLEGHLVCYNSKEYKNFSEAVSSPRGLYVIGVFYEIGAKNEKLEPLLKLVSSTFKQTTTSSLNVAEILPTNLDKYYRYSGSLTTPPCTENVMWTVLATTLTISEDQMKQFRSLKYDSADDGSSMTNNYRPVVSLTDKSNYLKRVVYSSFDTGSSSRPTITVFGVALSILITLIST